MKIKQHRPAYFTGFVDVVVEFSTREELFQIDFVKSFSSQKNFSRFSLSENYGRHVLMAEFDDGYSWWVVGYIDQPPDEIGLHIWEPKYKDDTKEIE